MLRSFLLGILMLFAIAPAMVHADPGTSPRKVTKAKAVKDGHGVVVISVRSAIFLPEKLNVYFVREGGEITEDDDVFRFSRKQGLLAVGNDTTDFAAKAFQLPAGRYRLVAHGVNCPSVPEPGQTCGVRVAFGGTSSSRVSRPSRGYGGETPVFEVRPGEVTYAGDYALDPRNTIVWSRIPAKDLKKITKRFGAMARGPEPQIPLDFHLTGKLDRRGMFRDMGRDY